MKPESGPPPLPVTLPEPPPEGAPSVWEMVLASLPPPVAATGSSGSWPTTWRHSVPPAV